MEILSKILIAVVFMLIIVIVILQHKQNVHKMYPEVTPTCAIKTCPECISITPDDIINTFTLMKPQTPNNTTVDDLKIALSKPTVVFPQNIQSMTPDQIAKLDQEQLDILSLGFMALMNKGGLSVQQLAAMSPAQISNLSSIQVLVPFILVSAKSVANPFNEAQMDAIKALQL